MTTRPIGRLFAAALACALLAPAPALAQHADDNAVTSADDAFGTKIGVQAIGLYDSEHVRGFSPRAAGNLRLEGLYFDLQTYSADRCLTAGETVRVGLSAQFFDTPSPTGIANFTLRTPGTDSGASAVLVRGPFYSTSFELDARHASRDGRFGVGVCTHLQANTDIDLARRSHGRDLAAITRWQASRNTELLAFWALESGNEHDELPSVYANGDSPPPSFVQRHLPSQSWARWAWRELNAGAILRSTGQGAWSWSGGLFRSQSSYPEVTNEIFDDLRADGTMRLGIDISPPRSSGSTSGEFRLLHRSEAGRSQRLWSVALRGRKLSSTFGGDWFHDYTDELGRLRFDDHRVLPEPDHAFSPGSTDDVSQLGLGVSFEQRWIDRASIGVGVQKVDYRREITTGAVAGPATTTRIHSLPTLATLRLTFNPRPRLVAYGGYTRGLEDSAPAPVNATTPFATAPATATWQVDAGLRWTPHPGAQLVAGVFQIQKAYFNLDAGNNYGQLGHVRHRGFEASATLSGGNGLTTLLGAVWLRPSLLLDAGIADAHAGVPLGVTPLLLDANLDYAPARWGPWAAGAHLRRTSSRPVGQAWLPAYYDVSLSVRYRATLFGRGCAVRLDADDLNDARDFKVNSVGSVLPEQGRRLVLTLTADF